MSFVVVAGRVYRQASPDKIPTWEEVLKEHGGEVQRLVKDMGSGDGYEDELLSEMEDRYDEAVYNVKQGFKGQRIWRVMYLSEGIDPMYLPRLGIYWSFEESAAEAHWGSGRGVEWTYEAVIDDLAIINKASSVYAYTSPSAEDEMEVTLKENMPLRVIAAWGGSESYSAELEFEESDEAEEYDFDWEDPEVGKWMTV